MSGASVVGYATLMNPAGAMRMEQFEAELVYVNGWQRFLGALNPTGKKYEDIFDEFGRLRRKDISTNTVELAPGKRFSAVLYKGVPSSVLRNLDRLEEPSQQHRQPLEPPHIARFEGAQPLALDGNVYTYRATGSARVEGRMVEIVRRDILPDPDYLERCRTAAAVHGPSFATAFEDTTFLADRETPLNKSQFAIAGND